MEMTHDKLVWLFSEDVSDYVDENQFPSEFLTDEDGNPRSFVVGEDVLGFHDTSDLIVNLQDRFAEYLVDAADYDEANAVEAAEELINQDFLNAYQEEFLASLKAEAEELGVAYFDCWDDHQDALNEFHYRHNPEGNEPEDYTAFSNAVIVVADDLGIEGVYVEEIESVYKRDDKGEGHFLQAYVRDDEDGAKAMKLAKHLRTAGYTNTSVKQEFDDGVWYSTLTFDLEPQEKADEVHLS